jgi:hypothetical protein
MTKLDKALVRVLTVAGQEIVATLVPQDGPIPAHLKLRRPGDKSSFRTITIDPPSTGELANR